MTNNTEQNILKSEKLNESKLNKYKDKNPELFKRLLKKYKHEPIVCRNWQDISVLQRKS